MTSPRSWSYCSSSAVTSTGLLPPGVARFCDCPLLGCPGCDWPFCGCPVCDWPVCDDPSCRGAVDCPVGAGDVCWACAPTSNAQEANRTPTAAADPPIRPMELQPSSRCKRSVAPRSQVTPVGVQAASEIGMLAESPSAKTT